MATRNEILDTVNDLVADFLYYDRKGDEELPVGAVELAISAGEVTVSDLVERFRVELESGIE